MSQAAHSANDDKPSEVILDDEHTKEGGNYQGACAYRVLGDGRALVLYQQLFNYRLTLGGHLDYGYQKAWDYPPHELAAAFTSLRDFDGEGDPHDGWVRAFPPMFRRRDNGDPAKEYIAP